MKDRAMTLVLCLGLALGACPTARAQELVVDNFIHDSAPPRELVNGGVTFRQSGSTANIVGGVRETTFEAAPLPTVGLGRPTVLTIPGDGLMILESGVKSTFSVLNFYGSDAQGNPNPLDLRLTSWCYDRFRIEFDSTDVEFVYRIQVFDGDGDNAMLSGTESTADRVVAFSVDFPFADFVSNGPGPIDWDDIDAIAVSFQTGNAVGGADFSVKRVVAMPSPSPCP